MAYQSKDLSVLVSANSFTGWHYTTQDASEAIDSAGYFNGGADMLRDGDELTINTPSPEGNMTIAKRVVTKASGGVVEIARFI